MTARLLRGVETFLDRTPFHPIVLAAYPVLLLWSDNLGEVAAVDALLPLLLVLVVAVAGFLVLAIVTRRPRAAAVAASVVIIVVLAFGRIRQLIEPVWAGSPRDLAVALLVLATVIAAVAFLRHGRLGPTTTALDLGSVVLLVLALQPIGAFAISEWDRNDAVEPTIAALSLPDDRAPRDIYHLVFDRYGSEAAMHAGHAIDNGEFTDWLREHDFKVVDDARANYVRTTLSLASTFGMGLLDDIIGEVGEDGGSYGPLVHRIQTHPAAELLREVGYEYVHVGSWFPETRASQVADRVFHSGRAETFGAALADLTIVPALLDEAEPGPSHARSAEYQFDVLRRLADDRGPKYVFAHVLLPHPPFVFLEDGTVDRDEATMATQLAYTNRRIRDLLRPLLALPEDEQPIIILQADEGPYPARQTEDIDGFRWDEATDAELITKFGVLMAFYLPGDEGSTPLPERMSLVNTFPLVYERYFAWSGETEPDRSYTSQVDRPYDVIDVTARLDGMGPGSAPRPVAPQRP